MMHWPSLLLAPFLALCDLAINYAMVAPACAGKNTMPLHAVSVFTLTACIAMSWSAWRDWRRHRADGEQDDDVCARHRVIALIAAMAGALSCIAVAALWFPVWMLSPCAN